MLNHFCNICNAETQFKIASTVKTGKNLSLNLESWECMNCERFSVFYLHSPTNKTFLISKNYGHKFINISYIYNPLTNEAYEIRINKKMQSTNDCTLILDPNNLPFKIDPLAPNEDIILEKIETYEIFS